VEGSCEEGNEPSCSIKCWEVFEWLHNCVGCSLCVYFVYCVSFDRCVILYDV
jgi:hypothetical protein